MNDQLLADRDVARVLSISPVTIRKQRFDRRRGLPHWFTLDPVMIGSVPRYRTSEVFAWVEEQAKARSLATLVSQGETLVAAPSNNGSAREGL